MLLYTKKKHFWLKYEHINTKMCTTSDIGQTITNADVMHISTNTLRAGLFDKVR